MGLKFTDKVIFYQKGTFSWRVGAKNYNFFNLEHAHKPKFGLFCYDPFLIFSALLSLLSFALHKLSDRRKKLSVSYG